MMSGLGPVVGSLIVEVTNLCGEFGDQAVLETVFYRLGPEAFLGLG